MTSMSILLMAALIASINYSVLCRPTKSMNGRKVVLMSMDGFRHDYLSKTNTPNFDALIKSGVKMPYLNNTFTTLTYPCHQSIVTGLYDESHGIVGNIMYDPEFNAKFKLGSSQARWWDAAEPVWVNAVKSGLQVASYQWPGSSAPHGKFDPTKWRYQRHKCHFKTRMDILVDWLSKDNVDFGLIYFPEPDHSGHKYGPDSPRVVHIIERMDEYLGYFIQRLEEENLRDNVDFILTSDHGMANTDVLRRHIEIEDYVNNTLLRHVVGSGATTHLRPQPGKAKELARALSGVEHMTVYLKEDIPEEYHYKNHRRVMPVVLVADEGWLIRRRGLGKRSRGHHGYSSNVMSMKPIFIASGPSFKQGVEVDPIKSVDIYPLLCHLLNLDPAPNNGSFHRVQALLRPGGPADFFDSHTYKERPIVAIK